MRTLLLSLIGYVLLVALIYGGFYAAKRVRIVTVEATDFSMTPDIGNGAYRVQRVGSMDELPPLGRAVAYYLPNDSSTNPRLGWLVAKEGDRLRAVKKRVGDRDGVELLVNGAAAARAASVWRNPFPEIVVPLGCVFIVCNSPDADSSHYGFVPLHCLYGRMPD